MNASISSREKMRRPLFDATSTTACSSSLLLSNFLKSKESRTSSSSVFAKGETFGLHEYSVMQRHIAKGTKALRNLDGIGYLQSGLAAKAYLANGHGLLCSI